MMRIFFELLLFDLYAFSGKGANQRSTSRFDPLLLLNYKQHIK